MADINDLPPDELADEGNAAPDGGEGSETTQQDDPVASLAREMGWAPKDEFRGDPEEWKPADQFIRDGRDIQRSLSDRLKNIEGQTQTFGRIAEQLANDRVKERDAYWQQQLDKAVDEGDHELKREALENLRKPSEQSGQGPSSEASEWIARNSWFNSDPAASFRAQEITARLASQGKSVSEQLATAESIIRREFPEHFKQPAKDPPTTQTGQSRKAAPTNRAKGFADMPAESQRMARDMADRNPGLTIEAIAKSYWADVAQQTRRA